MPKLSVITVCYNNLEGLKKTIDSVASQTWNVFEYIIIDGGSDDGTKEFLQSRQSVITYWVSEPDNGIYQAMNKGIHAANGEYLLFLNSGDHFYNNTVLAENHSCLGQYDLTCFNLQIVGRTTTLFSVPEKLRFSNLYFSSLPHSATFIKKELFAKIGYYDESLRVVADWKFFLLALFIHHCTYIKIQQTLSTFYLDGISSRAGYGHEREFVLKEYFSDFVPDYDELGRIREFVQMNRPKMLYEIEQSAWGRKMVSFFFQNVPLLVFKKENERYNQVMIGEWFSKQSRMSHTTFNQVIEQATSHWQ